MMFNLDPKFKRNVDGYRYPLPDRSTNYASIISKEIEKSNVLMKVKTSHLVSGTSHIVDPRVRKVPAHTAHPLATLELKQDDINLLKPMVYGSNYNLQQDPNPFYAPWNPPQLRRAEDEGAKTPVKYNSDLSTSTTSATLIGKFKEAMENPKQNLKNCSMFDCSKICFAFDKIHNPNDIGSVPLQDSPNLEDGEESIQESVSATSSKSNKKVTLKTGKVLLNQVETVYKPFRKSRFLDSPHLMPFFVLKGKPLLCAPLSFLGNTFMGSKKLLAQSADSPLYKKLSIHRYEINMEGFRDEQITFQICEKRVSVTGRTPPSARTSYNTREAVEIFHLAPFLNMNHMRIYRTKTGHLIFEEKWKGEDDSSEEEANPTRRRIKKKNTNLTY